MSVGRAVAHLVAGPPDHGVVRCALELAASPALREGVVLRVGDATGPGGVDRLLAAAGGRAVHVHVTDRLFGSPAGLAADALEALAAEVPLTVTLHDIPQPSDGEGAYERRAAAYARIVAAARGVVVSSRHEELLLDDALDLAGRGDLRTRPRVVVPLPIDVPAAPPEPREPGLRDVAVLGFLYPGKGHDEALAALGGLPPDVGLLALGRPSDGHEDLADDLAERAGAMGRRCRVTGFVPDDQLPALLAAVAVPAAPHRHLSASGSINTWLAAGRRPLVPRGRYVTELEERCPGALWIYDDLAEACSAALADPAATWLDPGVRLGPTRAEAGEAYARVLGEWHA